VVEMVWNTVFEVPKLQGTSKPALTSDGTVQNMSERFLGLDECKFEVLTIFFLPRGDFGGLRER
jgi:hypothetical protein